MSTRRDFLLRAGAWAGVLGAGALVPRRLPAGAGAAPGTPITVYKSATCGCCAKWVAHLRASGFAPVVHDEENMDAIKDDLGVPNDLRSCHTAVLGRYLIEGHVPAADLRRALAQTPAIMGLAAPGMPKSSPGMAAAGEAAEPYEVVAFTRDGATRSFARH